MGKKKLAITLSGLGLILVGTAKADMTAYGFRNISANNVVSSAIGEAQLSVQVSDVTGQPHQVLFTFLNSGPDPCSITDVYFDDGTLLGISSINNGAGVIFSAGAQPGNLPSGKPLGFAATASFSASSDSPTQPNGVNPGESLDILFDLQGDMTYQNVIDALQLGLTQGSSAVGSLLIGIHVQGFANGESESFINQPPVPAPAAALLGLIGVASVGILRRRFA